MTNPHRGEVNVTLAGQTYRTKLNLDSIARLETQLNRSIIKVAQTLSAGDMTISEMAAILHKAIRGGGHDMDIKQVNQLIWDAGLPEAMKAVAEVVGGIFGVSDELGNEGANV